MQQHTCVFGETSCLDSWTHLCLGLIRNKLGGVFFFIGLEKYFKGQRVNSVFVSEVPNSESPNLGREIEDVLSVLSFVSGFYLFKREKKNPLDSGKSENVML